MKTMHLNDIRAEIHSAHAHVFTGGNLPIVTYYTAEKRWSPFTAEYDGEYRQVTSISAAEAADRVGASLSLIERVAAAASESLVAAHMAASKRIDQGRRAWASMTAGERQAMNDYAMKTEGHTID